MKHNSLVLTLLQIASITSTSTRVCAFLSEKAVPHNNPSIQKRLWNKHLPTCCIIKDHLHHSGRFVKCNNRQKQLQLLAFYQPGDDYHEGVLSKSDVKSFDKTLSLSFDRWFISFPLFSAFLSFGTYPEFRRLFHATIMFLSQTNSNDFIAERQGFQASFIVPVSNGVVTSAVSLLFATLFSTTVVNLIDRQLSVRTCLNNEIEEVLTIKQSLDFIPRKEIRNKCHQYLDEYSDLLKQESSFGYDFDSIRISSHPLVLLNQEILQLLNHSETQDQKITQNKGLEVKIGEESSTMTTSSSVLNQVIDAICRLKIERSKRITALQSSYPPLHYFTMFGLIIFILSIFLIQTDDQTMFELKEHVLESFELRSLWSMLVTTFTALACVLYDLANPFSGTYKVRI